ncbi:MAG TPA: glycosyltransferase family 4 protein [Tepidisphaeraceae bacterium]|jgi:glycosyltransferase involved in cell wall biosynthesis
MPNADRRVLIIADNASSQFGGEALHPLRYFKLMRRKGVDVRMITHARNRANLAPILGDDLSRVVFVEDSALHRMCARLSRLLPPRIANFTVDMVSRIVTQVQSKRLARELIAQHGIEVVHQPTPISPKEISFLHNLGVPVVMGPLDGNMEFPPAFRARETVVAAAFTRIMRPVSNLLHTLVPGKRDAAVLLVSNERTRRGLPKGFRGRVTDLVENGVELDIWHPKEHYRGAGEPTRFIYLGRLVGWKAVDLLIKAFAHVAQRADATLTIIGDGNTRADLERLTADLGLGSRVEFAGWRPQPEAARMLQEADAFILPSLYECGGAVVLEAMATGLPVIATNWGGPADYVDAACGILVDPASEDGFITGMADAMVRLAESPALRQQMGQAGRRRAESRFDWNAKVDALLDIFDTLESAPRRDSRPQPNRFDVSSANNLPPAG